MGTARAARAHILCTLTALLLLLIASTLTYVFLSKVPDCKKERVLPLNVSAIQSLLRHASREYWLFKALGHKEDGRLMWENEWVDKGTDGESILEHNNTWINIREEGVYLVYIQVNFDLNTPTKQSSPVALSFKVDFNYGEGTEIFSAAHDVREVNENMSPMLNTFLLMNMNTTNQLSVRAFPSDQLMYSALPFSTHITIIKWADSW